MSEHRIRGVSRAAFFVGMACALALGGYLARSLVVSPPVGLGTLLLAVLMTVLVCAFAGFCLLLGVTAPRAVVSVGPERIEMTNVLGKTTVLAWTDVRAVARLHRIERANERLVGWSLRRRDGTRMVVTLLFAGAGEAIERAAKHRGLDVGSERL